MDLLKVDKLEIKSTVDDEFVISVTENMITQIHHNYNRLLSIFHIGNDKTAFMLEDAAKKVVFAYQLDATNLDSKKDSENLKVKSGV